MILEEAAIKHKPRAMAYRQEFINHAETTINGSGGLMFYDDYDKWLNVIKAEKHIKSSAAETPSTTYFMIDTQTDDIIGTIRLRHHLTDELRRDGGNIGYGIRPTKRGKGYGTIQLSLVLEKAKHLGMDKVMITCSKDNRASAAVAKRNGGVLAGEGFDEEEGKVTEIYWICFSRA